MNLSDFICGPDGEVDKAGCDAFRAAVEMFARAGGIWTPEDWIALPAACRGIAAAAADRIAHERIVAQARAQQGPQGFAEVRASLDGGQELESLEVDKILDVLTAQAEASGPGGGR